MKMKSIGDKIKIARIKQGLNQKDLAKYLGITSQAVSGWERGISYPQVELYESISKVLNVSKESLFFQKNDIPEIDIINVPFMEDIMASAGNGFINYHTNESYYPLPMTVYQSQKNKDSIICIKAIGDSMEPIIKSGSILAINRSVTNIEDGCLYVIEVQNSLRVKELSISTYGVIIKSYNKVYNDECIDINTFSEKIRILGKVFWFSSIV